MKKDLPDYTNEELVSAWRKGKDWLTQNEQITGSKKNREGKAYDHETWLVGLKKIEAIEDEMIKRGMNRSEL